VIKFTFERSRGAQFLKAHFSDLLLIGTENASETLLQTLKPDGVNIAMFVAPIVIL